MQRGSVALAQLLPNAMTLGAVCAGLTSIRLAIHGRFDWAVLLLVLAAVLDGLDGIVARALKSDSLIGAELDSLADVVNFGVAPALVLYCFTLHTLPGLGWGAVLAYAACCTVRLARFNVRRADPDGERAWFVGVPSPMGALLALAPVFLSRGDTIHAPQPWISAGWLVGVAILMVSRLPTPSLKLRVPRRIAGGALAALTLAAAGLAIDPWRTAVVLVIFYLAALPAVALSRTRRAGANTEPAEEMKD